MQRRTNAWLLALAVSFALPATAADTRPKLRLLTTLLPIYCFASNVAGDRADVGCLIPADGDAHDFQFTPRDRDAFEKADLILVNDLRFETWLNPVLRKTQPPKRVVECSAGLEDQFLKASAHCAHWHADPDHTHGPNLHLWLDPRLACRMASNVLHALVAADPAGAAFYRSNTAAFVQRLLRLDLEIEQLLAPCRETSIVTYHDAFPYFARRYGLKVAGVIEETPGVSPTPKELTALGQTIKRETVKVIFTEQRHSQKLANRLGRDFKLPVARLDTLESGLLEAGAYEAGLRRNARVLREILK